MDEPTRWSEIRSRLDKDLRNGTVAEQHIWLDAWAAEIEQLEQARQGFPLDTRSTPKLLDALTAALELLREAAAGEVGFNGLQHAPVCREGTPHYRCKCGLGAWLEEVAALGAKEVPRG